jgi:hypothetical protein
MHTSYSYKAAIMGDSRDWMYECFKKGGCHTSEWFDKTQEFLDHADVLSQIDNIRCLSNKCRNMTSHNKRHYTFAHIVSCQAIRYGISTGSHALNEQHN